MAAWKPYVIPFAVFLLLTEIGSYFPEKAYIFYILKTFLVGGLLLHWRGYFGELRHRASKGHLFLATLIGLFLVCPWVAFDHLLPKLGESSFNPFSFGLNRTFSWVILGIRLLGAILVVPLMEELFWRSFLMRYLISKDFKKIPLGTYQPFAFWAVTLLFGLEHFRFIPGFLAGAVYGFLVCRTKNLWPAILAHIATNLALGIYVILTGQWQFW
jgi:CAAX prenyl protease-like protein